ncbi:hypothetical protein T4C_2495 [Trichinella pseudospiralis]|uniref:LisH domain-containing protein n=1 Tax=Trichinella pseudospiralis TaxID=6337 RepID=A0A0V1JCD8_TRIPS|nr:hypothetical protein T4C_2495 [Trichinella pseudospiralis]
MVRTSVELSESTFESEDLNSEEVKNGKVVSSLNLANCPIAERNALKVAIRNAFLSKLASESQTTNSGRRIFSKWCDSQVAKYLKCHGYACTLSTFVSESHQLDESQLHDIQFKSDISSSSALLSLWESIEMKYNEKFTREVCNMQSKMENELQLLEQTMTKRLNEEIANLKREYDTKEKSLINEYKALKIDVANEKLAIENEQRIVEEKLAEKAESLKEQEDELVSLAEEVKTWLCREEERINQRKRDLFKQESMIKFKEEKFIKNYDQIVQTIRTEEQQQVDSCYQRMRAKEKKFQQLIKLFLSSEEGRDQALNWVTSERNDRISALQKIVEKLRERLQKFQKENKRLNRQLQANSDYDILQEENKRMTAEIDQLQANWLTEKKNLLRKNYELSKKLKIFEMNNLKRNDSTDSGAESRKTEDNTSSIFSNEISSSKNPLHNSTWKEKSKFDNLNHYSFLRIAKDLDSRCNLRSETLFHNLYKNANPSDDESSGNFAVANKTDLCEPLDLAEVIDLKIMKLDQAVASYQEDYFTKNTKKMLNSIDSILRNIETLQRNTGLDITAVQSAETDQKRSAIISAGAIAKNKIVDGDDDDADDQARQEHFSQIETLKEDKMENTLNKEIMINDNSKFIKMDDNWESRLLSKNASQQERRNDIQSPEKIAVAEKSDENEIPKDHQLDELSKNDALIDPIMTKYLQMMKNKRRTEAEEDSPKVYPVLENDSTNLPTNLQFSKIGFPFLVLPLSVLQRIYIHACMLENQDKDRSRKGGAANGKLVYGSTGSVILDA